MLQGVLMKRNHHVVDLAGLQVDEVVVRRIVNPGFVPAQSRIDSRSQEDDIDEDNPQPNKGDEPLNKALELLKAKNS